MGDSSIDYCPIETVRGYVGTYAQALAKVHFLNFVPLAEGGEPVEQNDVNADGKVNILDATEIQKYLTSSTTIDDALLAFADADGDGEISVADATEIQKIIVK